MDEVPASKNLFNELRELAWYLYRQLYSCCNTRGTHLPRSGGHVNGLDLQKRPSQDLDGTHAGSIFELFIHMLDPAVNKLGSSVSDDELVTNLLVVSYILSAAWKIRKVMQRLSKRSVNRFQPCPRL